MPRDRIEAGQSARCPARAIFGARGAEPRKVREAPDPFEPGSSDGTASAARFSTSPSRTLDRHLDPQRPFVCPLGPFLGPFDPAASDIASRQEPQIVRPTKGLWGFLLRFGTSRVSLISVRSVVQIYPGPLNPLGPRDRAGFLMPLGRELPTSRAHSAGVGSSLGAAVSGGEERGPDWASRSARP